MREQVNRYGFKWVLHLCYSPAAALAALASPVLASPFLVVLNISSALSALAALSSPALVVLAIASALAVNDALLLWLQHAGMRCTLDIRVLSRL
jgi:hypothetical protein